MTINHQPFANVKITPLQLIKRSVILASLIGLISVASLLMFTNINSLFLVFIFMFSLLFLSPFINCILFAYYYLYQKSKLDLTSFKKNTNHDQFVTSSPINDFSNELNQSHMNIDLTNMSQSHEPNFPPYDPSNPSIPLKL